MTVSLADLLFGRPLRSKEERAERCGPGAGIAIFGLDALSSAAYGPEAAQVADEINAFLIFLPPAVTSP